jgi:hypothetical protein
MKATPVTILLSDQLSAYQTNAKNVCMLLLRPLGFFACQRLALRGHKDEEGNSSQLLAVRFADVPELKRWLSRANPCTHHSYQDEILQLYGTAILRHIILVG